MVNGESNRFGFMRGLTELLNFVIEFSLTESLIGKSITKIGL